MDSPTSLIRVLLRSDTDAIPRFTIGFRTLPQEVMPVEPQAKEVSIQTHGHDKYRRTIADVILPDGTYVNHTLVKDGWCWWYRKYEPTDTVLEGFGEGGTRSEESLVC